MKRSVYMPIYFFDFGIFFVVPLTLATILYGLIARILFLNPMTFEKNANGKSHGGGKGNALGKKSNHCSNTTATSRRQVSECAHRPIS